MQEDFCRRNKVPETYWWRKKVSESINTPIPTPIPKIIWQTFYESVENLHPIIQEQTQKIKRLNPTYKYCFFNDDDIENFVKTEFVDNPEIQTCFNKLNIMVAKVDLWRYLILYKYGGVYLDMDSSINRPLDELIFPTDNAILSSEGNIIRIVQWALIFSPNHPILKYTIEHIIDNIKTNKYPNDILRMTGPAAFTQSINNYHRELYGKDLINDTNPEYNKHLHPNTNILYNSFLSTSYRVYGIDYNNFFEYKYPNHHLLYQHKQYWRNEIETKPLICPDKSDDMFNTQNTDKAPDAI